MPPCWIQRTSRFCLVALAVGGGLPAGALVVGAGALLGPWIGLVTVLLGQMAGLTLNWRLCRGVLRPRMQRWLEGRRRGRRLLLLEPAKLRLAAIPMALVNAACALGPTPLPEPPGLGRPDRGPAGQGGGGAAAAGPGSAARAAAMPK